MAPDQLPDFESPPVKEVVAGVQFEPLQLPTPWLGRWWGEIHQSFPHAEEKPSLDPLRENLGKPQPPRIDVQLMSVPSIRYWFMDQPGGSKLVQVQNDRLVFNWRGHDTEQPYPRFGFVRDNFSQLYDQFESFVAENVGLKLVPNNCEMIYVNQIPCGEGWETLRDIPKVIRAVGELPIHQGGEDVDTFAQRYSYKVRDRNGDIYGRLYVAFDHRYFTKTQEPLLSLELAVRAPIKSADKASVLEFMDCAHRDIVLSFAALTTEGMHKIWRRKDV